MAILRLFPFLTLLLYLCIADGFASGGKYQFDNWNTDNGLPQNGVREIAQTPDGYLWFTTFDGLVRFDGVKFTTFNKSNSKGIINNRFAGLYVDADGTLYATTVEDGILTVFRDSVFSSYDSSKVPGHYIRLMKPDENGEMRFLTEDDDRSSESWYFLRDGQFVFSEKFEKDNSEISIAGRRGNVWTISLNEAINTFNGISTVYPIKLDAIDRRLPYFEELDGTLWLGGNTLVRLKEGKTEVFDDLPYFTAESDYHSFWQEADGSVWFANGGSLTLGAGIVRYQNGEFEVFGKNSGLTNSNIFDVFKDREGTIWVASNKGLNRLRKKVLSTYSVAQGLSSAEVYPIYRDRKNAIWLGSATGLDVYQDGKFTPVILQNAAQNPTRKSSWVKGQNSVQSLFEDSTGTMWVGVAGAVYIIENGEAKYINKTIGHHTYAIYEDRSGIVWAATGRGLLQFKNKELIGSFSTLDGLPNNFMTSVFQDSKGRMFFGGLGGLTELRDGEFYNFGSREGFTTVHVRTFHEDSDGTIWIGTYDEGIIRYKDGRFKKITAEDGLFTNGVFAIREDSRGNFWISSNRGIYRLKRSELNDFADGKIAKVNNVSFGKADGMLSTECNGGRQPSSVQDADGNFWFPTQEGVVVIDPNAIEKENPIPPPVVIESVSVEREKVEFRNGIKIEPGRRNIEIEFTALSLIKSDQLKFKYKLEGHDTDWVEVGSRRSAYYSSLPPGSYQFTVIAANSDGIWNETGATIAVELKPFFYQTGWFYLLIFGMVALALFIGWKLSVYQLQRRERQLTDLVTERTKELKQANETLKYQANSDGLTNVANRRRFEEFLSDEWSRASRFNNEISMILIDIDYFKLFNDTYGHQAGDECLKKVAAALQETINRPTDLVARFGGEEFAIVLAVTDIDGTMNVAENVMENIKALKIPHSTSESGEFLTVSIGVATTLADSRLNEHELVEAADKALYAAKANGRNQVKTFDLAIPPAPDFLDIEEIVS